MSGNQLKFETWPIDRFRDYERNPRKNDAVVDQMVDAIKEFGFRIPIVVQSDGLVVDGHLRLKAARKIGMTELPCVLADDLSEAQIKAFRILANKSANWAAWDKEMLAVEFDELAKMDFKLEMTGFTAPEIDFIKLGWEAASDPREKDPAHLRGILQRVSFFVPQDQVETAKKVMLEALMVAGIAFEQ